MKHKILDALREKFEGISDSVLDRIASKLAKTATTAEQVAPAVEGVTVQQIIDSYTDSRATEAAQTAVRNYESKHGIKDGKPIDAQKPSAGGDPQPASQGGADEVPAWAKALTARLDKMESDRTTTSRKEQLKALTQKLPKSMRGIYDRYPVEKYSSEEFTALLTEVTTEAETLAKEAAARGGVFGRPTAATGGNKTELSEAQIAAISKRSAAVADGAQPF